MQELQRDEPEIERLLDILARAVKSEAIPQWLDTPNKAFDGLKTQKVGNYTDQYLEGWKRGLEPPTLRTTI